MTLRYYVCGEEIYAAIALFSLSDKVDRVFVCHERCVARLGDHPNVIAVVRVEP